MNLINEIIDRMRLNTSDIDAAIDMQLSTESLDLLENSPYQSEIAFNRLLPYADKIENEANDLLSKIKANFGWSIMLRDINPGSVYWSQILTKYIVLYGLRFTKDEHITFIKISYALITIPNLQPSLVDTFGKLLLSLLKKKQTISPNELELQWKPLYNLCQMVLAHKSVHFKLHRYPALLESTLDALVHASKIYFPLNATQEILDELRPKLCPLDVKTMYVSIKLLNWFLPTQLPVEKSALGYELWFHEFMEIWDVCHNMQQWENDLMRLMAKLAANNIGYIDWDPYIPILFTRLVRSLNLPVHYKKIECLSDHKIEMSAVGEWIASVLGNHSKAQTYLEKFIKTTETYFHPANYGLWLPKLEYLFIKIIYFVGLRLHRERHAKITWENPIPDSYKLTEKNIDDFVNCMMPVAMTCVFNKRCSPNFCYALQCLALMRPNLVIPNVLEKLYPSLDIDIEPHKLITAMTSMVSISRPLVQGSRFHNKDYAYAEGPFNVLPLLFSSLPGIDPNDPSKCFATSRLISTYVTLVPIVDCSNSKAELNEDERMIISETSRFEDFVLQFMNRVFILIGSSSLELVRLENQNNDSEKSSLEAMIESSLYGVFTVILQQCSKSIFTSALNKFRSFIMQNTLETKIAGQLVAVLCKVFCRVNSKLTLRHLLTQLAEKILEMINQGDDVIEEENLDTQFLYLLLLLHRVVGTQGDALLSYMDTILQILDKILYLKSNQGNQLGCQILKKVLESFCNVQPVRIDSNLDDPEYPYLQDWGESIEVDSAKIKWYVPGEEEMAAAELIFARYFVPAVSAIENYIKTKNSLSREKLQSTLRIINSSLEGCRFVLPIFSEAPILSSPYESCIISLECTIGNEREIKMPDGSNVRSLLVKIMTALQDIMLQDVEDDTKSLLLLVQIWQNLSMSTMMLSCNLGIRRRNFNISKKSVEDKITGNKGYLPQFLLERVAIQHELRKVHTVRTFTKTSQDIMLNLFKLSTSQYSRIRATAQSILWEIFNEFPNAPKLLIPYLVEILKKDTELHHDAYKGVLYLINQNKGYFFLTKGDWQILSNLLPALVLSKPSEKPSVIHQQDQIIKIMTKSFTTINITISVPDNCVSAASELWNIGIQPSRPPPNQFEIQKGAESLKQLGIDNLQTYNYILDELIKTILVDNLHWRHRQMAMNFISALVHPDHAFPISVVRYFLNALIHDSIDERKLACIVTVYILKQLKRKHSTMVKEITNRSKKVTPGCRADNEWLQYRPENRPVNENQWDESRYVHKQYIGYYSWPKILEVYAPSTQQPNFDRETRDLSTEERAVDAFFSSEDNVQKLVQYLSLEEKKGKDKFNPVRYVLFKGLFRNHGDAHVRLFLRQLDRMVRDKQESVQRCAAEIVCGLVLGSKHWPFQITHDMWLGLLPIIRLAIGNLTEETLDDWVTCFFVCLRNRDPNKIHWLLECLIEESDLDHERNESSFLESARLLVLQTLVKQQGWRISGTLAKLIPRLRKRLLENPFENVRDRLASILVAIFHINIKFPSASTTNNGFPEVRDFVAEVLPQLQILLTSEDRKSVPYLEAAKLLNSVCRWVMESAAVSHFGVDTSFYDLYPVISQLENDEADQELSKMCNATLAVLAQMSILPVKVPAALDALQKLSRSQSWSSRAGSAQFLQVFLFHNMSTLLSDGAWIDAIREIVLRLMEDERLEVREYSAQVLNGMLHCTLISDKEILLEKFKRMSRTKLHNKKIESSNRDISSAVRLRHAGVLGMCAFIQAHPYDIPKDVPPIFEFLSLHLNDPEPIPITIRKTLNDFKRTHCDGWTGLQGLAQELTEEQYALLQDLTVPPSYYA